MTHLAHWITEALALAALAAFGWLLWAAMGWIARQSGLTRLQWLAACLVGWRAGS